MEKFKQEIWKKNALNIKFDSLNSMHTQSLMNYFKLKYDIQLAFSDNATFFNEVFSVLKKEEVILSINEKNGFIQLCQLLNIDISQTDFVTIIWNLNNSDRIKLNVLLEYWEYIWYGTSDELCLLYFSKKDLFILISDYGTIYM